jgi:type I restriction enzyme, S subunit
MNGWKECSLGEVVTFQRGFDITQQEQQAGIYPVVSSSGIKSYHSEFKVKGPGVVIGRKGTLGTVFYLKKDFWPHDTTLWVKNYHENYPLFTYYFLKEFDFAYYDVGSSNPTLNRNHIHVLPCNLPPLSEQRAIASVLSSLDDKIDLLHRQNKTLEGMAEALWRKMFVDNKQTNWTECTVNELADHEKSGIHPNKKPESHFYHYSIPAFDDTHMPIQELGAMIQSNKYNVLKNSILFSKLNPHRDKRIWLILGSIPENSVCSTEFQVIKPNADKFLYFLFGFFKNPEIYGEIASGVGGTSGSHQRIDPDVLFKSKCFIPDDITLLDYNEIVSPIFQKAQQNLNKKTTLIKLRDNLLPKLISGEIRVKT